MKLSDKLMTPSWIIFQLLEQCNLRCRMCYEWGETGSYHRKEKLAALDLPVVLRTVEECLPTKPAFEFFGGEPLLYAGIWEVIRHIRKGGCTLAFSTNGTSLERDAESLVESAPNLLWVSLDGPEAINDAQRGAGVYQRVMRGITAVHRVKAARRSVFPRLGITCTVTPSNYSRVQDFFLGCLDMTMLSSVSVELQSYMTDRQARQYSDTMNLEFGVSSTPYADAYVRDPSVFSGIDFEKLTDQLKRVSQACAKNGVGFFSQPRTLDVSNIRNYFTANWDAMTDRRSRCAVPWIAAEISARGDVTPCHSFYDLTIGNIYERSLLEIWRGARLKRLRSYLRGGLFPVCTACCRYYNSEGTG